MSVPGYIAAGLLVLLALPAQGASEKELIAVLESGARLERKARACQELAVVGGQDAIPVLAALLDDERLGDYARFGLQPIADSGVDEALRDAMGRLEGRLLAGVVNSIGVRRDESAVTGLRALAGDPARGVAPKALMALGRIATDEALVTVQGALADGPPALRVAAAHAALVCAEHLVAGKRHNEASGLYDAVRDAGLPAHLREAGAYGAMVSRGEAGIPLLLAELKSEDMARVGVALRAARTLPGPRVSDALAAELASASPTIQARLVTVLVARGDTGAREGIEALADSKDQAVRLASLRALGEIGGASSVGVLTKALAGDSESVSVAGSSLRALAGEGIDEAILSRLPKTAGTARRELIGVLAGRHCVRAAPALLEETANADAAVARAAFKALGDLAGPNDLPAMINRLLASTSPPVVRVAERAVIKVAGQDARAVVSAYHAATSPASRVSLLRVLGGLGGENAYAEVVKATGDREPAVRDAAVRILTSWPDVRAAEALLGIVRQTQSRTNRALALRGYVRLLGKDASLEPGVRTARCAEAMSLAGTDGTRKAVLGALANVRHPDALNQALSHTDDAALRSEAEVAALTIARAILGTEREAARAAMRKLQASPDQNIVKEAGAVLARIDQFSDAITAWRISGPYLRAGKKYDALFDIVFEPEKPDAGNVTWQPVAAGTHPTYPQILDLRNALGGDQRVAYALTWVHSETARPASLQLGSDDGIKAWLNGELVHARNVARAAIPYTDKVNVELNKGWNPLLLKITQNQIPWEFCARMCGQDGERLQGLRFDPNHDGEWRLP